MSPALLRFDLHNPVVKALVGPDLESEKLRTRDDLFSSPDVKGGTGFYVNCVQQMPMEHLLCARWVQ